mmetsp:Transcript_2714/g.6274  ORF Transcript_2714/g.6274 Transcript_2714/m.6274 type:complete len:166 (+) Transcript_2714:225-722(+)
MSREVLRNALLNVIAMTESTLQAHYVYLLRIFSNVQQTQIFRIVATPFISHQWTFLSREMMCFISLIPEGPTRQQPPMIRAPESIHFKQGGRELKEGQLFSPLSEYQPFFGDHSSPELGYATRTKLSICFPEYLGLLISFSRLCALDRRDGTNSGSQQFTPSPMT